MQGDGKTSLLCLYYPQQLLPALAAVLSFRRHRGTVPTAPLHVFVWNPGTTECSVRERRAKSFRILLADFPWATLVFPDQREVQTRLSHNAKVRGKAAYLRQKFGDDTIDAIYYAHDISADFIAQSAMQAFPSAARICFGDALGVVYGNDYFTALTYPLGRVAQAIRQPALTLRNLLFRLKRAWTLPPRDQRLDAGYVVPILPCDPGGDFFAGKQLLQTEDASLFQVLHTLSAAVEDCLTRCGEAPALRRPPFFVMLLGSYSESRLSTEAQELQLYVEVARRHVPAGGRIFLKAHPVSTKGKVDRIARALASNYEIIATSVDEWPIELMPSLIEGNRILSLSYSSVSLLYLYGARVTHVLDRALIDQFFPERTRQWVQAGNELYLAQLEVAAVRRAEIERKAEIEACRG